MSDTPRTDLILAATGKFHACWPNVEAKFARQLERELARANAMLANLLCRIHRDGGQYISRHGLEKSVEDANLKVAALNAKFDQAGIEN